MTNDLDDALLATLWAIDVAQLDQAATTSADLSRTEEENKQCRSKLALVRTPVNSIMPVNLHLVAHCDPNSHVPPTCR